MNNIIDNRLNTRNIVVSGLLLALGIIMPSIFHTTEFQGTYFTHILLLGGFTSPFFAFLLGILTPIINSLITGMPVMFPMAVIMVFELGIYGLVASLLYRRLEFSIIISLIVSMIVGRIMAGIVVYFLIILFTVQMDPIIFVKAGIMTGLPGIIIQLILIPTLMYGINRYTTINLD